MAEKSLGELHRNGTHSADVYKRQMLSCLVDADHMDTARHYRKFPQAQAVNIPTLRAKERLEKLNQFVSGLGDKSERSKLRSEMYRVCRDSAVKENIVACNSPVGSAKTTALMAYALQQAISRKSRRIFVVLPFTNIIRQSVEVYREALCLPADKMCIRDSDRECSECQEKMK